MNDARDDGAGAARVSERKAISPTGAPAAGVPAAGPVALLVLSALSVQGASALATQMFDAVGAAGAAWLRLVVSTIVLGGLALALRRRARPAGPRAFGAAVVLGLSLAVMNTAFYGAIERLPLGVAVAIEFVGPLGVAVAASRRRRDLAWVTLAAASVAALTLPRADLSGAEALGVLLALVAGAAWAVFILAAARVGRARPDGRGLLLAVGVGALVTTPGGIVSAAGGISAGVLALAVGVGVLGSALPYSLEVAALRRISAGAFGVMMAIEPAAATLVGLVFLSQVPSWLDLAGIVGVAIAVCGASSGGALVAVAGGHDAEAEGRPSSPRTSAPPATP